MDNGDLKALVAGAVAWLLVIPAVKLAGSVVAEGGVGTKLGMVAVGAGISVTTTPILSRLLGWTTRADRVRGIALALGAAQTIDGLVHFFAPDFYASDPRVGLASAGNIFLGAGLLGIFSVYT